MLFTGWALSQMALSSGESMLNQDASSKASTALTKVDAMKSDIERLLMITEALWIILKEEHGYTDDMLVQKINEVDLKDGKLDGRVAPNGPAECPQCHRKVVSRSNQCLFCGEVIKKSLFER
jgi:hypothetical protein